MTCKTCGGELVGDGYTEVCHCENLDLLGEGYEPDAGPIYCHLPSDEEVAAALREAEEMQTNLWTFGTIDKPRT